MSDRQSKSWPLRSPRFERCEARYALSSIPLFSSNPSSTNAIYLDFDGHIVSDDAWSNEIGLETIHAPAYDIDGIDYDPNGILLPNAFSNAELENIDLAWRLISEDYTPFNVNVTTVEPEASWFTSQGGPAGQRALRVIVSSSVDDPQVGGFGRNWLPDYFGAGLIGSWSDSPSSPVFVFANNFGPEFSQSYIGTVASHEVGHAFDLRDDSQGLSRNNFNQYYAGHTDSGSPDNAPTSWGPIMGGAEHRALTQWSMGEYQSASHPPLFGDNPQSNTDDDIAILASHLGYRPDDHGNTPATATTLSYTAGAASGSGIIGRTASGGNDIDYFRFDVGASPVEVTLRVDPLAVGANLDAQLRLFDADNPTVLLETVNPVDAIGAAYTFVASGAYFVEVDGVGKGDPLVTGYTDYGSLGQYTLTVTGPATAPRVDDVIFLRSNGGAPLSMESQVADSMQMNSLNLDQVNQIRVVFDRPIDDFLAEDLKLRALIGGAGFTQVSATSVLPDADRRAATWTLSGDLPVNVFALRLEDRLASGGVVLDGEWTNANKNNQDSGLPTLVSGNGTAGGDFVFTFVNFPAGAAGADFNSDYAVDLLDLDILGANFGATSGATLATGDANGDGRVDLLDLDILGANFGDTLGFTTLRDLLIASVTNYNNSSTGDIVDDDDEDIFDMAGSETDLDNDGDFADAFDRAIFEWYLDIEVRPA